MPKLRITALGIQGSERLKSLFEAVWLESVQRKDFNPILHDSRVQTINHYAMNLFASLPSFLPFFLCVVGRVRFWGHSKGLEIHNKRTTLTKLNDKLTIGDSDV